MSSSTSSYCKGSIFFTIFWYLVTHSSSGSCSSHSAALSSSKGSTYVCNNPYYYAKFKYLFSTYFILIFLIEVYFKYCERVISSYTNSTMCPIKYIQILLGAQTLFFLGPI